MHPPKFAPVIVLLVLLAGGYYLWSTGQLPGMNALASSQNTASGFIEGKEVSIASEFAGRIEAIAVDEGQTVSAGQELVRLDRSVLNAQIAQAQAVVNTANAQLAQVKAGARPEDIQQAQAALEQAKATRDGLKHAWEDAKAIRDNPQELDARLGAAKTQVETSKHQLDIAQANAISAATQKDVVGEDNQNPKAKAIVQQWVAAEAAYQVALAAFNGSLSNLQIIQDIRNNPLTLSAQVDAAKAQLDAAEAAIVVAQTRLDSVKAGATKEQIAVAESAVKQTEAALAVLQAQGNKMTLKSPLNGIVTRRAVNVGEIATPGALLLSITDLNTVKLTIYVPETQIGNIKFDDEMNVQVDSFPSEVFKGKVVFIASQAEFTPRNVQTKAERVNTVFAVKLQIPNPEMKLKPGMPADATLK